MTAGAEVEAGAAVAVAVGTGDQAPDPFGETAARVARSQQRIDRIARTIKVAGTVTLDGSGNGIIKFHGPATGYRWTVRRISVVAAAGLTTSMGAGLAGIYAGTKGAGNIVPANLEWIITPLPNAATFSTEHLPLAWGEDLCVVITGGTASQAVIASVAYQLYGAGQLRGPE